MNDAMRHLRCLVAVLALMLVPGLGTASVAPPGSAPAASESDADGPRQTKKKKKKRKKSKVKRKGKRKRRGKTKADEEAEKAADALFDASASDGAPAPGASKDAPALDLTGAGDTDAARKELLMGTKKLLMGTEEEGSKGGRRREKQEDTFDFGGGIDIDLGGEEQLDFGGELADFDLEFEVESLERERFDEAMSLMSDEEYSEAAVEFATFLEDPKFREFKGESEYQLAKALYKLGLLDSALRRFRQILNQGASHRRYRKSIEWLFFISRKMADETPVLAELAQFRNVTFPKAYRNEYRYLLSKYLFIQAERFEIERVEQERMERLMRSKATQLDFEGMSGFMAGGSDDLDFSGGGFDFGDKGFGGDSGDLDFGGGGNDGLDFGAGGGDDGLDFGADAGFDFGVGGDAPTVDEVADAVGPVREEAPTTTREAIDQGVDMVVQVEKESKFFPRAKYLEGLMHYLGGRDQAAVNAFQEVVRILNPREGQRLDPQLREMAFLSLARIHFGYKQFNRSAYYYDLIDRDSENWLTALFEASWAYYRRGDFEKALGNLLTLHSPFFEREYFPESQLVKAIIYFEACRYGETRDIVDTFYQRFKDVMAEIQRIAESKEAPELLYDRVVAMQNLAIEEGGGDDVTERLVSLALTDPGIRTARNVVRQTQDSNNLLKQLPSVFRDSRLGRQVADELQELAEARAREAGEITRKKFERELYNLKSLLAQALRIKIEVVAAEKTALQARMRGEATHDEILPAVARSVVGDEQLYWPYEGEYWRDELGTYELDFSMCRPLAAP